MPAKLVSENIIISDATVLINFLNTGTFQLLLQCYAGKLRITDAVVGEIKINRRELDAAIHSGSVAIHKVPLEKINHLTRSLTNFDLGEASCLVLAKEKSWKVATDDGAAKRLVKSDLGAAYLLTTFDILIEMVNLSLLEKGKVLDLVTRMETDANFLYPEDEFKEFKKRLESL